MFRTKFTAADGFAILAVLLAAGLLFWQPWNTRESGAVLVIATPEGSAEYALSENRTITVTSGAITLTVEIADGAARVTHSNCRDGVCVASGAISKSGETVLCAPAGVSLTVKGGGDNADFIAG